jgi:hypothetical protein
MTSLFLPRVQIPTYSDRWIRGDRFGEIVETKIVKLNGEDTEVAAVKLDSGVTRWYTLADCEVVS